MAFKAFEIFEEIAASSRRRSDSGWLDGLRIKRRHASKTGEYQVNPKRRAMCRAADKRWRAKNPEATRAMKREEYLANRETYRARDRRRYLALKAKRT